MKLEALLDELEASRELLRRWRQTVTCEDDTYKGHLTCCGVITDAPLDELDHELDCVDIATDTYLREVEENVTEATDDE